MKVLQFAEELRMRLENQGKMLEADTYPEPEWRGDVASKLEAIADLAEFTAKLMKEAEWLYSGDTSEDTFLLRVTGIKNEWIKKRAPQALSALCEALDLLKEYVKESGGCDHSVGICLCGEYAVIESAEAELRAIEAFGAEEQERSRADGICEK